MRILFALFLSMTVLNGAENKRDYAYWFPDILHPPKITLELPDNFRIFSATPLKAGEPYDMYSGVFWTDTETGELFGEKTATSFTKLPAPIFWTRLSSSVGQVPGSSKFTLKDDKLRQLSKAASMKNIKVEHRIWESYPMLVYSGERVDGTLFHSTWIGLNTPEGWTILIDYRMPAKPVEKIAEWNGIWVNFLKSSKRVEAELLDSGEDTFTEVENLVGKSQFKEAIKLLDHVILVDSEDSVSLIQRAYCYSNLNQFKQAFEDLDNAINIEIRYAKNEDDPHLAYVFYVRGNLYHKRGVSLGNSQDIINALKDYTEAIRLDPKRPNTHNVIAWIYATAPFEALRNGEKAVKHALIETSLGGSNAPAVLDTLAAAYAESGKFKEAVTTQKMAIKLAASDAERAGCKARLKLYLKNKPYRDTKPKK